MLGLFRAAVAGLRAHQQQMEVVSSNLSNIDTTGFRRGRVEFEDYLYQAVQPVAHQPITARQIGIGVGFAGVTTLFDEGLIQPTDNPLDLAITGNGFFQVQLPGGQIAYTRAGGFHRGGDGQIVTADELPIGPGIVLPEGAEQVEVREDGEVSFKPVDSEERRQAGVLTLATFVNPGGLLAIGPNRFIATEASGPATVGTPGGPEIGSIVAGALERSNVEFSDEMTNLVLAQRAYGLSATVLQTIDEMIGMAANLRR